MEKQSGKTLVEILAVELKEWPDRVASFGCDADGEIRAYDEHGGADEYHYRIDFFPEVPVASEDRANGFGSLVSPVLVTRAEWEAERAKLEGEKVMRDCVEKCEPGSKPKANGWVRNRGRKNPFDVCTLVDARLRSGDVVTGKFSENLHWIHTGNSYDVMAYRVNESVDAAAPEVTAPNDGPLQWRDRVTEIDREVEELQEERESLIQKLADEGFKLIKLESVELPDMSDWRNWKVGDLLEVTAQEHGHNFPIGEIVRMKCLPSESGGQIDCEYIDSRDFWWLRSDELKFHSRPTK